MAPLGAARRSSRENRYHAPPAWNTVQKAAFYIAAGRYTMAEPLLLNKLNQCEREVGCFHLNTARALHNLAIVYRAQGRYADAMVRQTPNRKA